MTHAMLQHHHHTPAGHNCIERELIRGFRKDFHMACPGHLSEVPAKSRSSCNGGPVTSATTGSPLALGPLLCLMGGEGRCLALYSQADAHDGRNDVSIKWRTQHLVEIALYYS